MRRSRRSSTHTGPDALALMAALALVPGLDARGQELAAEPTVGCSEDVEYCFVLGSTVEAWGQAFEVQPRGGRLLRFGEDGEGDKVAEERWIPFPGGGDAASASTGRISARVAVRVGGGHVLVVTDREGVLVWAEGQRAFRPLVRSSREALADRVQLTWRSTLISFSDDGPVAYLRPLGTEPVAFDLDRRRIVEPTPRQRAELERKTLVEARIRLMAEDPWLKVVGLQWAVALGDFQHVDLAARYIETETNPRVRMLARELLAAYLAATPPP